MEALSEHSQDEYDNYQECMEIFDNHIAECKDFLANNPALKPINKMTVAEKETYFKGSPFGSWVLKNDMHSNSLKALYKKYYNMDLGVDSERLRVFDMRDYEVFKSAYESEMSFDALQNHKAMLKKFDEIDKKYDVAK